MSFLKDNDIVLFQGDSVTDVGWRDDQETGLGWGYPRVIATRLRALYPEKNIQVVNRGISGNRVCDLKNRWTADCVDIKPTVVSILIGVNDTWRAFDHNDPTSLESYRSDYRDILARVRDEIGARVILIDPFSLPTVPEHHSKAWRADLCPRIDAVRELARAFHALYIPLDALLNTASLTLGCATLSRDGVHPTETGHTLIAEYWLKAALG